MGKIDLFDAIVIAYSVAGIIYIAYLSISSKLKEKKHNDKIKH